MNYKKTIGYFVLAAAMLGQTSSALASNEATLQKFEGSRLVVGMHDRDAVPMKAEGLVAALEKRVAQLEDVIKDLDGRFSQVSCSLKGEKLERVKADCELQCATVYGWGAENLNENLKCLQECQSTLTLEKAKLTECPGL